MKTLFPQSHYYFIWAYIIKGNATNIIPSLYIFRWKFKRYFRVDSKHCTASLAKITCKKTFQPLLSMHAYTFIYTVTNLIRNSGYTFADSATNSQSLYRFTNLLTNFHNNPPLRLKYTCRLRYTHRIPIIASLKFSYIFAFTD